MHRRGIDGTCVSQRQGISVVPARGQAARVGFVWRDSRHSCGQEESKGQGTAQGMRLHGKQGHRHV